MNEVMIFDLIFKSNSTNGKQKVAIRLQPQEKFKIAH